MVDLKARPRIVVIGAGVFGGWTALHLQQRGAVVTLLDAWGPGNSRASSGGETRVIRAVYGADRIYVEMVSRAFALWEQLDAEVYVETGTLWMNRGDDAYVRSAVPHLREVGFPIDQLELAEARRRWPQIDFGGVQSVWLEKRAGALSARRACAVVRDAFVEAGGTYRVARVEPGAIANDSMTPLQLDDRSRLDADVYVFACGPWLGKLFPDFLGKAIEPTRQEVHFFGTPAGSQCFTAQAMPVWMDFGERVFYGIPDTSGRGFKVADDTRGEIIDPTTMQRVPSEPSIARARRLLAERFPELADAPLLETRVCQYENSPDGHLIVDRHPHAHNAWVVGGGSGHGFKLAPAVGELAAEAIVAGREIPAQFRVARLAGAKRATQFERWD